MLPPPHGAQHREQCHGLLACDPLGSKVERPPGVWAPSEGLQRAIWQQAFKDSLSSWGLCPQTQEALRGSSDCLKINTAHDSLWTQMWPICPNGVGHSLWNHPHSGKARLSVKEKVHPGETDTHAPLLLLEEMTRLSVKMLWWIAREPWRCSRLLITVWNSNFHFSFRKDIKDSASMCWLQWGCQLCSYTFRAVQ